MDTIDSTRDNLKEHVLLCLSSSPSNAKIVHTAAKMATAFGGTLTALYVQTPTSEKMSNDDKKRLQYHTQLAESLGADIATVYGEDISYQIAEFARLSNVTKIVLGRSSIQRRHFWSKPLLSEKLTKIAPNLDIYIIPDTVDNTYMIDQKEYIPYIIPSFKDLLITISIVAIVTMIGTIFLKIGFRESNIITVYLLGVLLTSLYTKGYACSVLSSFLSVLLFNFFLTEPRLTFRAYHSGYPVTFLIMLIASIITGTLASKLKAHAKLSAQAAYRTQVLFDTNQLLQRSQDDNDILNVTASQLIKLLDRDIIAYLEVGGNLSKGYIFDSSDVSKSEVFLLEEEQNAAMWVLKHKERAGASCKIFSQVKCLYLPIQINHKVYGVIGIHIANKPLEAFENSVIISILGECALAIENSRNAKEKELAAVTAKNEQLRANLLRTISHDLRTTLTSISGNATTLLSNYQLLDDQTRIQMFTDIYDDSQWLINLVENLLSVTRLEEGRMNLNISVQLVEEVIEEALRHIDRKRTSHEILVEYKDDLIMAKMDARMIIQVIINMIDNALKYTPAGSVINIVAQKVDKMVSISIMDNGPGIPNDAKSKVFEMFFIGNNKIVDSRRSLGLGLALCKSIINAHGGEITLSDNVPHGCVFTFTLPLGEVDINE
ncbi:MAG: sensor histidine kinase KdpD [Erysipelotrichales bacterium]|nr:sensor histidine kinase KdpD [Erysipelotrichales bacterium]